MSGVVRGRRSDSGFTLLELMIVISILGLIVVALTAGVRFAGQAWQIQAQRIDRQGDADAVQNVLRQLVASAKDFQGNARRLEFVSRLPAALARGGLYDVELGAVGDRLVMSWRPHFKGPMTVSASNMEAQLIGGVTDFQLRYFVAPQGWQNVYRDKRRKLSLIAFSLQLADGRHWTPLVVAPMIEPQPTATN